MRLNELAGTAICQVPHVKWNTSDSSHVPQRQIPNPFFCHGSAGHPQRLCFHRLNQVCFTRYRAVSTDKLILMRMLGSRNLRLWMQVFLVNSFKPTAQCLRQPQIHHLFSRILFIMCFTEHTPLILFPTLSVGFFLLSFPRRKFLSSRESLLGFENLRH